MRQYNFVSPDTLNKVICEYVSVCNEKKLIGFERTNELLTIIQKHSPKGISIIKVNNQVKLQFTKPTLKRSKYSINELFSEDGLYNALDKAFGVFNALKECDKLSDFEKFFDDKILQKTIVNDVITVGKAIEKVRNNYFENSHKNCSDIDRNNPEFKVNFEGNYDKHYNRTFKYLQVLSDKPLTAKLLINFLEINYSHLMISKTKCTKGFKAHLTNCQKLLIDTKLHNELTIFQEHFGRLAIVETQEEQEIDINLFLDFRNRVLGLNGYSLTKKQRQNIESRKSVFKALSINLLYGFRGSECLAIMNLDEPVTVGGRAFKALHDPTNKENVVVLNSYYEITDSSGKTHKITIKTGNRIARPMSHPDHDLVELLEIKDSSVKLPVFIPESNSKPRSIKDRFLNGISQALGRYIKQVGLGFTQTHALRHLCNYHGKLSGLTTEQRAKSLGHSETMNQTYDKHLSMNEQVNFLMTEVNPSIKKLESENEQLRQENLFFQKQIEDLKHLLLSYQKTDNVIQVNFKD